MSGYVLKQASAPFECAVDWSQGYLEPGEFIDGDLGWAVAPSDEDGDLIVAAQRFDDRYSYAVVSRGRPGQIYMVSATACTNTGRQLQRSVILRVAA